LADIDLGDRLRRGDGRLSGPGTLPGDPQPLVTTGGEPASISAETGNRTLTKTVCFRCIWETQTNPGNRKSASGRVFVLAP
jgi:hypothetical protein